MLTSKSVLCLAFCALGILSARLGILSLKEGVPLFVPGSNCHMMSNQCCDWVLFMNGDQEPVFRAVTGDISASQVWVMGPAFEGTVAILPGSFIPTTLGKPLCIFFTEREARAGSDSGPG